MNTPGSASDSPEGPAGGFAQSGTPQEPPTPSGPAGFTYAPAGAYPGYRPPGANALAMVSLILGIVPVVPIVGSILAIVFGNRGKKQIDESGGLQTGRGMAIAGIWLGWLGAVAVPIFVILIVVLSVLNPPTSCWTTTTRNGTTVTVTIPCGPGAH